MPEPSERELLKLILADGYSSANDYRPTGPLTLTIDNSTEIPAEWHDWFIAFLQEIDYQSFWDRPHKAKERS